MDSPTETSCAAATTQSETCTFHPNDSQMDHGSSLVKFVALLDLLRIINSRELVIERQTNSVIVRTLLLQLTMPSLSYKASGLVYPILIPYN